MFTYNIRTLPRQVALPRQIELNIKSRLFKHLVF
jgi:hypothetical protein